jgi:hypothetical protein
LLITVKLERFAACVCELVIEGNTREDFDKILSRVPSARLYTLSVDTAALKRHDTPVSPQLSGPFFD